MVDSVPPPYRVERLLGSGGMADVYLAWNEDLRRNEALKFLSSRLAPDEALSRRFLNEARVAAGLHHPHIAAIYTVSDPRAPRAFFAMQHIAGGDLADRLAGGAQLPLDVAKRLLAQVADALDYAHAHGVVHRDVKPANVLLDERNGEPCAYVVDFGIARAQEAGSDTRLTRAGMIVGTPEYMSPEQAGVGGEVCPASDQYALAIVAYEMLCGRVPFPASERGSEMSVLMAQARDVPPPPTSLRSGLPKPMEQAILKALSKNPADRFPSCRAFIEALNVGAPAARRPASGERPAASPTPNRVPLALGTVVIAGLAMVGLALARSSNKENTEKPPRPGTATPSPFSARSAVAPQPTFGSDPRRPEYEAKLEHLRDLSTEIQANKNSLVGKDFAVSYGKLLHEVQTAATDLVSSPFDDLHDFGHLYLSRRLFWLAINQGAVHAKGDRNFQTTESGMKAALAEANLALVGSPDPMVVRGVRLLATDAKEIVKGLKLSTSLGSEFDSVIAKTKPPGRL